MAEGSLSRVELERSIYGAIGTTELVCLQYSYYHYSEITIYRFIESIRYFVEIAARLNMRGHTSHHRGANYNYKVYKRMDTRIISSSVIDE